MRHVPLPNVRLRHDVIFALDCEAKTSLPKLWKRAQVNTTTMNAAGGKLVNFVR
jgi:hypothetical protein